MHGLAASLRHDGIDARIDIAKSTDEDWMMWMEREVESADFVLCIVNASYQERFAMEGPADEGHGVGWEAGLIRRELYDGKWKNKRFLPCYFQRSDRDYVPKVLKGFDKFLLDSDAGYEKLLRRIIDMRATPCQTLLRRMCVLRRTSRCLRSRQPRVRRNSRRRTRAPNQNRGVGR